MASMLPVGLSVHNFISSVGADAGFAAIVGLAVLVLLYFAHARDTANLQEEAEELAHRLLQAETRLAELSRQAPVQEQVAAQQPASAGAPAAAPGVARVPPSSPIKVARSGPGAVPVPVPPAGMGAPALAAATRVVPLPAPDGAGEDEADAAVPAEPAEAEQVLAAEGRPGEAGQGARALAASAPVRERPVPPNAPRPATAAGGANGGSGQPRVATPVSATGAPSAPPRPPAPVRSGTRPGQPRRPTLPPRGPAARRSRGGRRVVLLIGALVAAAAIAALVIATATGGSTSTRATHSPTTNAPSPAHHAKPVTFNPSSVTVAVLNGTATNQLAHTVSAKLAAQGYKPGTLATAANQSQSATVVAYLPGFRDDALHVATALKLGPASVQPVDSSTQAVACPPPSPCAANVVVTVGADLSTL